MLPFHVYSPIGRHGVSLRAAPSFVWSLDISRCAELPPTIGRRRRSGSFPRPCQCSTLAFIPIASFNIHIVLNILSASILPQYKMQRQVDMGFYLMLEVQNNLPKNQTNHFLLMILPVWAPVVNSCVRGDVSVNRVEAKTQCNIEVKVMDTAVTTPSSERSPNKQGLSTLPETLQIALPYLKFMNANVRT